MKIQATQAVAAFKCLQDKCPDTCCKSWGMQVDDLTFAKYQTNGLDQAVTEEGGLRVMKRGADDHCVKFSDGVCGIHKDYGAEMLGDVCYLYPRTIRKYGDDVIATATLSCPEITRLMIENDMGRLIDYEAERLPQKMFDCKDAELDFEDAIKVHNVFLGACNAEVDANKIMLRIYSASQSLSRITKKDWPDAAGFMIKMGDGKMPVAEIDAEDNKRVLQIFAAIIHATGKKSGIYLAEVLDRVEKYLGVKIDWETLEIQPLSSQRKLGYPILDSQGDPSFHWDDKILKKYISAQLSFGFFPFAGIGKTINERAKLLCYKFALTKLALSAAVEGDEVKTIQSIARIIDHIADPTLVFNLMRQFGWERDGRMVGLLAI